MSIAAIDFLAVPADFVQIIIEMRVVFRVAKPAHQRVYLRYIHAHERARVELLPDQHAELLHSFLARRRRRTEVGSAQELRGELPAGLRMDLNQTGSG